MTSCLCDCASCCGNAPDVLEILLPSRTPYSHYCLIMVAGFSRGTVSLTVETAIRSRSK